MCFRSYAYYELTTVVLPRDRIRNMFTVLFNILYNFRDNCADSPKRSLWS